MDTLLALLNGNDGQHTHSTMHEDAFPFDNEERYLILDMALDVTYNETAHETTVHFDKDPDAPTVKYTWLEYLVFALLVPFAVMLVALCFFLSRRHERHKRAKRNAEMLAQYDCLRDKIQCKPWCHPDEQTRAFARSVMYSNSTTTSPFAAPNNTASTTGIHFPDPPEGGIPGFKKAHNGFYCVMCVEAFSPGEPVYNSNNPDCQHQIHMKCMNSDDGWMSHKNICPVCRHPFVVLRPHEGDWVSKAFSNSRTASTRQGSTIRNVWRSLRGSDNHRKEFESVIKMSTRAYPEKILEGENEDAISQPTSSKALHPPICEEESLDHQGAEQQPKEEARSGGDVEQGQQSNGNHKTPPLTDSVLST